MGSSGVWKIRSEVCKESLRTVFENRYEAGGLLAEKLNKLKGEKNVVVLGIPRGGVITASVIASELILPLDVVIIRKIGAPYQKELAIGAVSEGGVRVLEESLIKRLEVDEKYIQKAVKENWREIKTRIKKFRGGKRLNLAGKSVVLVDDGIATGATIEAAIGFLKKEGAKKIILATPVAPRDTLSKLTKLVDEVVVLETPSDFRAVGQFYHDFPQVTDEEVVSLLK